MGKSINLPIGKKTTQPLSPYCKPPVLIYCTYTLTRAMQLHGWQRQFFGNFRVFDFQCLVDLNITITQNMKSKKVTHNTVVHQ